MMSRMYWQGMLMPAALLVSKRLLARLPTSPIRWGIFEGIDFQLAVHFRHPSQTIGPGWWGPEMGNSEIPPFPNIELHTCFETDHHE